MSGVYLGLDQEYAVDFKLVSNVGLAEEAKAAE